MQDFIAQNPGVIVAAFGVVWAFVMGLFGIIAWLYTSKKGAEADALHAAVETLTEALSEVKTSFDKTAAEVFTWLRGTETRLSRLEAQHDQIHSVDYPRCK